MATIALSAAGMAIGGSIGGSVLGLGAATIGRAVGATLGRVIDERLLGQGAGAVETGRIDRFRLTGASEGAPVAEVHGRFRIGGQVIWASRFAETRRQSGGGKGAPQPATVSYSYSVSLAIALCAGEIRSVGRIWADGEEIAASDLTLRVYPGSADQLPDPLIEAIEGAGTVPAYRGTAYVVIEDLELARFGNRVPQFSFEVLRGAQTEAPDGLPADLGAALRGVALIPGTGEYALATEPVTISEGFARTRTANVNSARGVPDLVASLDALESELPRARAVSLVVSWFGDDLRAGTCTVRPKVERRGSDGREMPWRAGGLARDAAAEVPRDADDRPVYGGTPADASVLQAVREMAGRGLGAMFYPFLLMDQMAGNALTDPWTGETGQPALPWRGRITTALAPGLNGSPDGTAAAEAEVAAFFGTAAPGDFARDADGHVSYAGPEEWSWRRMILHYATLLAGEPGLEAFCIGSEFRGLTGIRGAGGSYPAVAAFRALLSDVRAILGPSVRLGYAADWTEYHGHQPAGTADRIFHLDPLWADPDCDFVGIDNYLPLSDWRDGPDHADAALSDRLHDPAYLGANVAGGEYFDWFYASAAAAEAQQRTPITDGEGEPWVWRLKDLKGWWENPHHDRIGGVRQATASPWVPGSKPIWFTEYGCAAVDKGTNEPNRFVDPKSSESALPRGSSGGRDDLVPLQYYRVMAAHFADPANNPTDPVSGHRMVDMDHAYAWAWDARPWPAFPSRTGLWADGENYTRGHWLNGRTGNLPLEAVVRDICVSRGLAAPDTSRLSGLVRGYGWDGGATARSALQPLMLAHAADAVEREGTLRFRSRGGRPRATLDPDRVVAGQGDTPSIEITRAAEAEIAPRLQLAYVSAEGAFEARAVEAARPDAGSVAADRTELPLVLTRGEARAMAERFLAEADCARDSARLTLPPSLSGIGAGDVVVLPVAEGAPALWRVDRVEADTARALALTRVHPETYRAEADLSGPEAAPGVVALGPVEARFLDLPLLTGDEVPHAPHLAATGLPWPGRVAVYSAPGSDGFALETVLDTPATMGLTETPLDAAPAGLYDRGPALRIKLVRGALASATEAALLAGANTAAIGDGSAEGWEVFQFRDASLVAPDTWELSMRLRGQRGTDGVMPASWPAGSLFVLLDASVPQVPLAESARGVARTWRYGPAARPASDPSFTEVTAAFRGVGLRPYPVAHLARTGPHSVGWIRRTRIGGDSWDGLEVPLGEAREQYLVRVVAGAEELRSTTVTFPAFTYGAAERGADGVTGAYRIEVAQVSEVFGPGPVRGIDMGG